MRANESSAEHTSDAARARSLSAAARKKDTAAVAAPAGHDSVESPHAIPALQRSAGNAAVAQLLQRRQGPGGGAGPGHSVQRHPLTVQRMGNTQSSGTGSGEGVELEDTPKDLNPQVVARMLAQYESMTGDIELRRLLRDLMPEVDKVEFTGTGAKGARPRGRHVGPGDAPAQGGHTVPIRDRAHAYRINLSSAGPREDQIATLVHEMTHVLNYEAYGQDGVPVGPGGQQPGRQDMDDYTTYVMQRAGDLIELLPKSGLPPAWQQSVKEKLRSHTATNPTTEYDTVLSHLLVWSEQYGDMTSGFHALLTRLVEETRDWRAQGGAHRRFRLGDGVTYDSAFNRLMRS